MASSSKWQTYWRDPPETQPLQELNRRLGLTQILISVLVIAVIVLSVLVWRMDNRIECLEQGAHVSHYPNTVSYHYHHC